MGTATATFTLCQWPSSSSSSSSSLGFMRARVSCSASQPQPQLSASSVDTTLCQIKNSGIIACLRANSAEVALEAANAAIAGGISVLEIVMSTPGVFEVIQQLVKEHPTMALGVGTVLRIEDAKTAINAGAKFLMSPAIVKDIMDYMQSGEILYIPGAMTPTEILSAWDAGAKIVKVYPVSALGGSQYISALKRPFPHVSMVASQGITIDSIGEYISRGASSVVLSDAIFDREAIAQCHFNKIYELANSATLLGNQALNRLLFATRIRWGGEAGNADGELGRRDGANHTRCCLVLIMLLVVIRVNFVLVIEIANDRKLKDCYCMKVAS